MDRETCLEKSFEIVAVGGNAKGMAYEALEVAEAGDFAQARELLGASERDLVEAHKIQTQFIQKSAAGEDIPIDMIFINAQDHLMCALEAQSLIGHLIALQEQVTKLEKRLEELEGASHV